jgi:hypothetical protein
MTAQMSGRAWYQIRLTVAQLGPRTHFASVVDQRAVLSARPAKTRTSAWRVRYEFPGGGGRWLRLRHRPSGLSRPGPLPSRRVGANSTVAHLLLTLLIDVVGAQRHQVVVDRCASRAIALQ